MNNNDNNQQQNTKKLKGWVYVPIWTIQGVTII